MKKRSFGRYLVSVGLTLAVLISGNACESLSHQRASQDYVISGGGSSGVYYSYGEHLASVLNKELPENFSIAESAGSVENLLRVGSGEALLGFAQSDAAVEALVGQGVFSRPLPIRSVARLYDEYVHVVVKRDSGIVSLQGLAGRNVSLGARNSGVNLAAVRVLSAAGVDRSALTDHELGPDESLEALKSGQIEGFFWVGGVPTPGLDRLAQSTAIRLLAINANVIEKLNNEHGSAYRVSDFPLGSYGWEEPTTTMTVPNYLIVSKDASPELVRSVTQTLFDSRLELASRVPAAALLDRRQAIFTSSVELHTGAKDYYIVSKK